MRGWLSFKDIIFKCLLKERQDDVHGNPHLVLSVILVEADQVLVPQIVVACEKSFQRFLRIILLKMGRAILFGGAFIVVLRLE